MPHPDASLTYLPGFLVTEISLPPTPEDPPETSSLLALSEEIVTKDLWSYKRKRWYMEK